METMEPLDLTKARKRRKKKKHGSSSEVDPESESKAKELISAESESEQTLPQVNFDDSVSEIKEDKDSKIVLFDDVQNLYEVKQEEVESCQSFAESVSESVRTDQNSQAPSKKKKKKKKKKRQALPDGDSNVDANDLSSEVIQNKSDIPIQISVNGSDLPKKKSKKKKKKSKTKSSHGQEECSDNQAVVELTDGAQPPEADNLTSTDKLSSNLLEDKAVEDVKISVNSVPSLKSFDDRDCVALEPVPDAQNTPLLTSLTVSSLIDENSSKCVLDNSDTSLSSPQSHKSKTSSYSHVLQGISSDNVKDTSKVKCSDQITALTVKSKLDALDSVRSDSVLLKTDPACSFECLELNPYKVSKIPDVVEKDIDKPLSNLKSELVEGKSQFHLPTEEVKIYFVDSCSDELEKAVDNCILQGELNLVKASIKSESNEVNILLSSESPSLKDPVTEATKAVLGNINKEVESLPLLSTSETATNNLVDCNSSLDLQQSLIKQSVASLADAAQEGFPASEVIMSDQMNPSKPEKEVKPQASGPIDSQGQNVGGKTKAQLKAERKAAFEAQKGQLVAVKAKEQKSKAELRAERRALQEAQRAAKGGDGSKKPSAAPVNKAQDTVSVSPLVPTPIVETAAKSTAPKKQEEAAKQEESPESVTKIVAKMKSPLRSNKIRLFAHLPKGYWETPLTKNLGLSGSSIHPSFIKLGLQIGQGIIEGSNARCIALLLALKQLIEDYVTPPQKELSRDLECNIKSNIEFLSSSRPLSVSMTNAVKYLQWYITRIPSNTSDSQAKDELIEAIEKFIKEDIILARMAISTYAQEKITNGDVILTYSFSSVVCQVLCDANQKKKFHVIVVDGRPKLQGRQMLRNLIKAGISCSYIYINAVSYVMQEVTKVILGAHSLQANGYVMSQVGSSQIALVAHSYNVPVLVCCETYKFSERAQTDSFVYNEIGDPNELVRNMPLHKCVLNDWQDLPSLQLLNLVYDITPPDFVSVVITEKGMLPCTSVPAVLRVKHAVVQERG